MKLPYCTQAHHQQCPYPIYRQDHCIKHWAWMMTLAPGIGPVEEDETGMTTPGRRGAANRYAEILGLRQAILEAAGLDWNGEAYTGLSRL